MKRTLIGAAVAAAAVLAIPAAAQMWGYGAFGPGYGMGPGMMGGYGMHGGMMRGYGYERLDLSAEQRAKLADIERDVSRKQWELMQSMHSQDVHMHDFYWRDIDEAAARKSYQAMSQAHQQMFETMLEARKRFDSVLTPEQREQLRGKR